MEEGEQITSISHFEGGDWLFSGNSFGPEEDGVVVCLACMLEQFPFLAEHAGLQPGFEAWIDEDTGHWVVTEMHDDDDH
jgi:hypothetical protein